MKPRARRSLSAAVAVLAVVLVAVLGEPAYQLLAGTGEGNDQTEIYLRDAGGVVSGTSEGAVEVVIENHNDDARTYAWSAVSAGEKLASGETTIGANGEETVSVPRAGSEGEWVEFSIEDSSLRLRWPGARGR